MGCSAARQGAGQSTGSLRCGASFGTDCDWYVTPGVNHRYGAPLLSFAAIALLGCNPTVLSMSERRWGRVWELGELESAIMDVMWVADRAYSVRDVRERMSYPRPVAYTTVMTVTDILHRKGVLHRDKHGRAWRYWPAEAREEHDARLMAEVLRSGGNRVVTIRRFIERVSDEEMESLRIAVRDLIPRRAAAS